MTKIIKKLWTTLVWGIQKRWKPSSFKNVKNHQDTSLPWGISKQWKNFCDQKCPYQKNYEVPTNQALPMGFAGHFIDPAQHVLSDPNPSMDHQQSPDDPPWSQHDLNDFKKALIIHDHKWNIAQWKTFQNFIYATNYTLEQAIQKCINWHQLQEQNYCRLSHQGSCSKPSLLGMTILYPYTKLTLLDMGHHPLQGCVKTIPASYVKRTVLPHVSCEQVCGAVNRQNMHHSQLL